MMIFFVIPLKEQNYTLVIQIKNFKLITTAIKNVNPQPIGNSNYQFFDDKIIQDLNYKWKSQLKSLKTQSNNERNWVSENGGLRQLKQVQWYFDSPQSAVQYFLENFEYFTEKGAVLDIFNSKDIKFFGEVCNCC
ncbi:MAG: hypothetical protein KatS3mg035_0633 [Bacteroidia bacterium]|nr:MAG: hypothetical protein KatS3mg035_0633 [Bacteroidia bacterium]